MWLFQPIMSAGRNIRITSEVVWLDVDVALKRNDVPQLTKKLIEAALNENRAFKKVDFVSRENHGTYSLYTK